MTIKLTIVLNGRGGQLHRTELDLNEQQVRRGSPLIQQRIHAAIAAWTLHPGDTIEILGNEHAFAAF